MACSFIVQFGCLYGYLVPHPASSVVVGLCAFMYFLIVSLMTLHAMFLESGALLEAERALPDVSLGFFA